MKQSARAYLSSTLAPAGLAGLGEATWGWLAPLARWQGQLFVRPFQSSRYVLAAEGDFLRAIERSAMAKLAGHCSHRLLLRLLPGDGSPDGVLRLYEEADGTRADLMLDVQWTEPEEAIAAFESAVGSGAVRSACFGPATFVVDDRVNVLTFTTEQRGGPIPPGARATAMGGGICIRACALTADETEMRRAIAEVARGLSSPGQGAAPQTAQASSAPLSATTPAAPSPAPAPAPSLDVDATSLIPVGVVPQAALPFAGTTSPEKVAELFDPVQPRARPPEPGPDETALVPVQAFVMPRTGTFRDQLGPLVVPVISLDEYAELRARLTVYGESHEPTLKRFGVAAREVHEAVRGRFSEYFLRDPTAQAQFLKAMQAAISRVRQERDKEGT